MYYLLNQKNDYIITKYDKDNILGYKNVYYLCKKFT